MRLVNPNVPDWFKELDDKEAIKAHIAAGWLEVPSKRRSTKKVESAKAVKAANETSSVTKAEEN